ncbi:lantibiotic immunity ABC transporter MutG family permease subunit [Clostridium sardiniense]
MFFRKLHSDWIRTQHTAIRIIAYFTPIIYPILILWYGIYGKEKELWQMEIYSTFYQGISILLPFIIGLLIAIIVQQEELCGDLRRLLSEPLPRAKVYISKLTMCILIISIDIILATLILLIGMGVILNIENIHYLQFIAGSALLIISILFLNGIHLLISFSLGFGSSIILGSIGSLIAALMGTGLGDFIWQFVPWAWPARLSCFPYMSIPEYLNLYNGKLEYINKQLVTGLILSIALFIVISIIGIVWFKSFEGKKKY